MNHCISNEFSNEGIKLFDQLLGIFWDVKRYDKQVSTMKKPSKFAGFLGLLLISVLVITVGPFPTNGCGWFGLHKKLLGFQ